MKSETGQRLLSPAATIAVVLALGAAGCRDAEPKPAAANDAVPEFSAKNGLRLPEATRRAIGLALVDVSEQKVTAKLELQLRIYERAEKIARATGLLHPAEAKRLKAEQPVEVHTSDGRTLDGKVTAVNEQLQKATGQVEVLVEISGPGDSPGLGAFVRAALPLNFDQTVVTIPRAALLRCSEGQFVYTVSGEHLVRTAVKVGAMDSERVEITDGLYAGDQIAAQPVLSLWLTELASVKGGQACCIELPKGK